MVNYHTNKQSFVTTTGSLLSYSLLEEPSSNLGSVSKTSLFSNRNTLYEIYFGKTRDIVNGLRSVQSLSDSKQQDELRKDLFNALAKKNVPKAE